VGIVKEHFVKNVGIFLVVVVGVEDDYLYVSFQAL